MAARQGARKWSSRGGRGPSGGAPRAKRTPTGHKEIERQVDVADIGPVEGRLGHRSSGSALVVAPEDTEEIPDTHRDTDDGCFYRAGYALRVREKDDAVETTMRSLSPAGGNPPRKGRGEARNAGKAVW